MSRADTEGTPLDCLREWTGSMRSLDDPMTEVNPRQLMRLSQVIEGEIVPRLMMLFETDAAVELYDDAQSADSTVPASLKKDLPFKQADESQLIELLLRHDAAVAIDYIRKLHDDGLPLVNVYLQLLAPAARRLGEMWERDECSFTAVTIGVSRMHQVLMHFSPSFRADLESQNDSGRNALIVPLPGEQHTFGLHMVVEFFRRKGWDVASGCPDSTAHLREIVEKKNFEMMGCSVSASRHLDSLADHISLVRKHSKNPDICILVGGQLFNESPELYREVGADATAQDGPDAVRLAELIIGRSQ